MVQLNPNGFISNPFESREDVERGLKALLDPLSLHTSPGGASISLSSTATHYDLRAVSLETFARPLWGLTSLLAGGGTYDGTDRWVRGLASGTDPTGEEYWGAAKAKDQRMVEMSPLSFAVCLQPDVFYHSQSEQAKKNIAAFLESCIGKPMPDTNWLWFRVFANLALRTISSSSYNPTQLQADLQRLESFQFDSHPPVGNSAGSGGWTNDGPTGEDGKEEAVWQRDYYSSSFAITFAMLVYARLCAKEDPERAEKYRKRVQEFCLDFVYYFADDGACIPFGRSMIYRFATISTFSSLALADCPPPAPLEWGHIKGLVLRHLRWWSKRPDIFRSDGTLNIGYGYDNMNMTENYNAPGSPYWCTKAFAILAAPPSHPFWTSKELSWPSTLFSPVKALPTPSHILCRSAGHTFLLSSGQYPHYAMRHGAAKYAKFAYSSVFGFSCPTGDDSLEQVAADSMFAVRDVSAKGAHVDHEPWKVRRRPESARIEGRGTDRVHLRSTWRPYSDVEVETWLLPPREGQAWYIRVHCIRSGRELEMSEGGWSTYGQGADGRALIQAFSGETSEGGDEAEGWARAVTDGGGVGVLDLPIDGRRAQEDESQEKRQQKPQTRELRRGKLVQTDPNSNIIFSRSILPSLMGRVAAGEETWVATGVWGWVWAKDRGVHEEDKEGKGNEKGWQKSWEEGKGLEVPSWVWAS